MKKMIVIISITVAIIVFFMAISNYSFINKGYLYFDMQDNSLQSEDGYSNSYVYDFKTKKYEKICLSGYDVISEYTPTENGYIAIVGKIYNIDSNTTGLKKEICIFEDNKTTIFPIEFNAYGLMLLQNKVYYLEFNDDNLSHSLICLNLETQVNTIIEENVEGATNVDNTVYFTKKTEEENIIYAIEKDDSHKLVAKAGNATSIVGVDDILIYENDKKYYTYNLDTSENIQEKLNSSYVLLQYVFKNKNQISKVYYVSLFNDVVWLNTINRFIITENNKIMFLKVPKNNNCYYGYHYSENKSISE